MDLRLEYETLGVYQDVALTSFDLLAPVLTPVFPAHSSTLYRLGIHHARAGLRIPFQANPKAFADGPVDPFPGPVYAPSSKVVIDGGPSREVVGEQTPGTTALEHVEHGV